MKKVKVHNNQSRNLSQNYKDTYEVYLHCHSQLHFRQRYCRMPSACKSWCIRSRCGRRVGVRDNYCPLPATRYPLPATRVFTLWCLLFVLSKFFTYPGLNLAKFNIVYIILYVYNFFIFSNIFS